MRIRYTDLRTLILKELRRDDKFISLLRGSGLGNHAPSEEHRDAQELADGWLEELEQAGEHLAAGHQSQVLRFVAKRWPGLMLRFHNDERAAMQTLYNLLDMKFNSLKVGD